jgi:hypothetical protein
VVKLKNVIYNVIKNSCIPNFLTLEVILPQVDSFAVPEVGENSPNYSTIEIDH